MYRSLTFVVVWGLTGCALTGCTFIARSPDQFKADTQKLVDSKQSDMRACYDGVLKTNPTAAGQVVVVVVWEKNSGRLANLKVDPKSSAPPEVRDCVTKSLTDLMLSPGDARDGEGMWTFSFAPPKA